MGRKGRGSNYRHPCPICGLENVSREAGTKFCISCSYKKGKVKRIEH